MKEIGGFIELEHFSGSEYHPDAVALNCGRNCLAYLIKAKGIKRILLPYYLCRSVEDTCKKYGVDITYYHIDGSLLPMLDGVNTDGKWLYLVNYYGQLTESRIEGYKSRFNRIIVDNAQDFFSLPVDGVDTIYTCRKYFGVPDGAYLYTDKAIDGDLETDISHRRMGYLLGRYEEGAESFYEQYKNNNALFVNEPIKYMSALTKNLMRGIDCDRVKRVRGDNFERLHTLLGEHNKLKLTQPIGPFMYPLYIEGGKSVRERLISKKIFIPVLWPDVFDKVPADSLEYDMAQNILPLPVDQRYTAREMEYIAQQIKECMP